MTETEWLASSDPVAMIRACLALETPGEIGFVVLGRVGSVAFRPSDRQLRLFACACMLRVPDVSPPIGGMTSHQEAMAVMDAVDGVGEMPRRPWTWCSSTNPQESAQHAAMAFNADRHSKADILREIAGNPFRPVRCSQTLNPLGSDIARGRGMWGEPSCDCRWLASPDVKTLAEAAYQERWRKCGECRGFGEVSDSWFAGDEGRTKCKACNGVGTIDDGTLDNARLLVLSDALEEAGCSVGQVHEFDNGGESFWWNDAFPDWRHLTPDRASVHPLIAHLRSPGPHYRGCWALDLIREGA